MPVDNPRQNKHGWWGTLTIDEGTEPKGSLNVGDFCVFVKTNKDSHFVSKGTHIKRINVFSNLAAAKAQVRAETGSDYDAEIEADLNLISSMYPNAPIVEILEVDSASTSPLTEDINELTKERFNDDLWLAANANTGNPKKELGVTHIKKGRKLKDI